MYLAGIGEIAERAGAGVEGVVEEGSCSPQLDSLVDIGYCRNYAGLEQR